jgi:hypothetical protein
MQFAGYIMVNGEKLKVRVRTAQTYNAFKLRKTGQDGWHMQDEERFLAGNPDTLIRLLKGHVVRL